MSRVSVLQNSYHVFNFDCVFTHLNHTWSDRKVHDKLSRRIGAITIELLTIL